MQPLSGTAAAGRRSFAFRVGRDTMRRLVQQTSPFWWVAKGCAMACRITDDVINALQHCRLKAYFQLRGEEGAQCGYEKLLIGQRANAQRKAIEKIRREYTETEVATDLNLSVANLRKGVAFILSARLDDDRHAVVFDAHHKID